MLKRSIIVFSLTLLLVTSAVPLHHSVRGVIMTPEEVEMLDAASKSVEDNQSPKGGNTFVRVLKAPFKAIGRLFGIGRKDDKKLRRLSRKDVEKFESVGMAKVVDARTVEKQEAVESLPTLDPNVAGAEENLERGRTLLNGGNVNEAMIYLSTAASTDPKLHEAHSLLGVAYETKGLRDRAFESFEKALKGDENNAEYLNNLGYLHFKNGNYDKAAKYVKQAVKVAPQTQRYWNNFGLIQSQRAKWDEAYECFNHAVGEYEGHMNVANRSQAMGHEKTAIKHLEQARALRPTNAEILLRLVVLYKRTGNSELAAEANAALTAVRQTAAAK
jgi:Tfp pilus assembly protein PilF